MELNASAYLLNLAMMSLTFVGFSTIVIVLRAALAAKFSDFEILVVRFFIEVGFSVAAFSLLPDLLWFFGLPEAEIWRFSSALFGLVQPIYLIHYLIRRRRVAMGRTPLRIYINFALTVPVLIGLWLNAAGLFYEPNAAPYALAITWGLIGVGIAFLQGFGIFLGPPPPRSTE